MTVFYLKNHIILSRDGVHTVSTAGIATNTKCRDVARNVSTEIATQTQTKKRVQPQ